MQGMSGSGSAAAHNSCDAYIDRQDEWCSGYVALLLLLLLLSLACLTAMMGARRCCMIAIGTANPSRISTLAAQMASNLHKVGGNTGAAV
jgi:hypothetical protein